MADNISKNKSLDDFWDIEQLLPKKKSHTPAYIRPPSPAEVVSEPKVTESEDESSYTIKRYIPPYNGSHVSRPDDFLWTEDYEPESSLIHRITVKKYKTSYNYYSGFASDMQSNYKLVGAPCDFVTFFSYGPQYDQMNREQLDYYLWFRECLRAGKSIKADQGYILLYIFELINYTEDPTKNLQQLMSVFEIYGGEFPAIAIRLADWICDYGFVHRLPPPARRSSDIVKKLRVLKEYFIHRHTYTLV